MKKRLFTIALIIVSIIQLAFISYCIYYLSLLIGAVTDSIELYKSFGAPLPKYLSTHYFKVISREVVAIFSCLINCIMNVCILYFIHRKPSTDSEKLKNQELKKEQQKQLKIEKLESQLSKLRKDT